MSPLNDRVLWVDVCGTLYDANTTAGFVRWHLAQTGRRGRLTLLNTLSSRRTPLRFALIVLGKSLGLDLLRAVHIAALKNEERKTLEASAASYCEHLSNKAIEPVHRFVKQMQADGWTPVLISNSLDIVVSEIGRVLGLQSLASQLSFRGDVCDGSLAVDLKGKKLEAFQAFHLAPMVKARCAVVTDNKSDRDLILSSSQVYLVGKKKLSWMDQYEAKFIDYAA